MKKKSTLSLLSATILTSVIVMSSCSETPKQEAPKETTNTETPSTETTTEPTAVNVDPIAAGKQLFESKCTACHKIDEKMIGPALKGVTTRRSDEWIIKMVTDPANMLATDADAKALLKEYNNVPMANLGVTKEDAEKVLEYLKTIK